MKWWEFSKRLFADKQLPNKEILIEHLQTPEVQLELKVIEENLKYYEGLFNEQK